MGFLDFLRKRPKDEPAGGVGRTAAEERAAREDSEQVDPSEARIDAGALDEPTGRPAGPSEDEPDRPPRTQ